MQGTALSGGGRDIEDKNRMKEPGQIEGHMST